MALTWQNVSPSNPAGILQAGNMAAASIAKGLSTVGDSMQQYAGDTKDAETGKLLLMLDNAKDRNERQGILETADRAYIDESIIAKDNQAFDAREQQQQNILFNQGIQTGAAKERTAQNDFMQNDALLKGRERIAAVTARAEQDQRVYQQQADQNAVVNTRAEAEIKKNNARNLLKDQREKTVFDQGQTALTEKQQLYEAGKKLVEVTSPLINKTNDISELIKIREDLRTNQLEDNPKAPDLIKKVNTKLGSVVNLSNLFPSRPGVPTPIMTITGTTQDQRAISANSNLQRTIDKLSIYLPNSTNDDLKSMASTILRNSSPEYRKAMNALKVTPEQLNDAVALEFANKLREYKRDGLTLEEIANLRGEINATPLDTDNKIGIDKSLKALDAEYVKVFTRTPLTNIIPEESRDTLAKYMDFGTLPFPASKVVDKRAVKKRHKSNIQSIMLLIPTKDKNRLSYEKIQQKVSNYLTRQPSYAGVLDAAGIPYTADAAEDAGKIGLEWASKRGKINDQSSVEDITNLYNWGDKNDVPNEELTELRGRTNKKLDKDKEFSNMTISAYEIHTVINDPSGKKDANGNPVRLESFDPGAYKKFRDEIKEQIQDKYKIVTEPAIQKMLDRIVTNHPEIVRVKTSYDDMLAFEKLLKTTSNLNTVKNKITDINFAREFGRSPVATLSAFDIKTQMTLDIIKDANAEDKADTIEDSVNFSRYVYNLLNDEYKGRLSPLEFGERAKRVMAALPPRPEQLGDEYTRERRGAGPGLWMYSDEEIKKAANIATR